MSKLRLSARSWAACGAAALAAIAVCVGAWAAAASTPGGSASAVPAVPAAASVSVPSNLPSTAASSPAQCIVPTGDRAAFPSAASDAVGGACCCTARTALRLSRPPEALPSARQGRAYLQSLSAEGGRPPYQFTLVDGDLPQGLTLDARGTIAGTPPRLQSTRFVVIVTDRGGARLHQTFDLAVLPVVPKKVDPPASAASKAPMPIQRAPLTAVEIAQASGKTPPGPLAIVHQLSADAVEALKAMIPVPPEKGADASDAGGAAEGTMVLEAPPETPASAASSASATPVEIPKLPTDIPWSEEQQTHLTELLKPLMNREYLMRSLFEDAVKAQACEHAWLLVSNEGRRRNQSVKDKPVYVEACLQVYREFEDTRGKILKLVQADRQKQKPTILRKIEAVLSAALPAAPSASSAAGTLKPEDVGTWLLPPRLVPWLSEAARQTRALTPSKPLAWKAMPGCGCAAQRDRQPLYAFYPAWLNNGEAKEMDFSLINRISYFALPLSDELTLPEGWNQTPDDTAFARVARRHGTRLDVVLYNSDWSFLNSGDADQWETERQLMIQRVATRVHDLLDTPLTGWADRAKAWMPGFAERQYLADGVTLVFDELPDPDKPEGKRFAAFYPAFVRGLADAMASNPRRQYAINLVMTGNQVTGRSARDPQAPFDVATLFSLLKAVEKPQVLNHRIVVDHDDYQRDANVELRFLVLLPEPTTFSKKLLRRAVEESPAVLGTDRRIFLRSIVPVLQVPPLVEQQFQDDLAYAEDNFGGLGVWSAPLLNDDDRVNMSAIFGPGPELGVQSTVCAWVCTNRWLVRLVFELLLLAGVVIWLVLQFNCDWRQRYGRVALLAGVPPALVAFALSVCDPAMAFLRNGTLMLGIAVAALVVFLIVAMLKRKVEKP